MACAAEQERLHGHTTMSAVSTRQHMEVHRGHVDAVHGPGFAGLLEPVLSVRVRHGHAAAPSMGRKLHPHV